MLQDAVRQFVDHVASAGGDALGRAGAKLLAERAIRFVGAKLGWESPETTTIAIGRLERLYEELYKRLSELEASGVITEESVRTAYEDPQGAAAMSAACETAIETDDPDTIGALAQLLAERAKAPASSRLALRVREAAEASRNLQPRQLVVIAQAVLANIIPAPARIFPGDAQLPLDVRIAALDAWIERGLQCVAGVTARFDDVLQLEAARLLLLSARAADYEGRLPSSAPTVGNRLHQLGGSGYDMTSAMELLGDIEQGTIRGMRAFERVALGAYNITDAGLLLGCSVLQQRGLNEVGVEFDAWSQDLGRLETES